MKIIVLIITLIIAIISYVAKAHKKEWIPIVFISEGEIAVGDKVLISGQLCRIIGIEIGEIQVRKCYPWEVVE